MASVDALPSIKIISQAHVLSQVSSRTIHDNFHIIHKSMDHFKGLRNGHSTFLQSETIEPL